MVFINPVAGTRKGTSLFCSEVKPMLDLAEIDCMEIVTGDLEGKRYNVYPSFPCREAESCTRDYQIIWRHEGNRCHHFMLWRRPSL